MDIDGGCDGVRNHMLRPNYSTETTTLCSLFAETVVAQLHTLYYLCWIGAWCILASTKPTCKNLIYRLDQSLRNAQARPNWVHDLPCREWLLIAALRPRPWPNLAEQVKCCVWYSSWLKGWIRFNLATIQAGLTHTRHQVTPRSGPEASAPTGDTLDGHYLARGMVWWPGEAAYWHRSIHIVRCVQLLLHWTPPGTVSSTRDCVTAAGQGPLG